MKKMLFFLLIISCGSSEVKEFDIDGLWFLRDNKVINSLLNIEDFGGGCVEITEKGRKAYFYSRLKKRYRKNPIVVDIKKISKNRYQFIYKYKKLFFKVYIDHLKRKALWYSGSLEKEDYIYGGDDLHLFKDHKFYFANGKYKNTPEGWLKKKDEETDKATKASEGVEYPEAPPKK